MDVERLLLAFRTGYRLLPFVKAVGRDQAPPLAERRPKRRLLGQ